MYECINNFFFEKWMNRNLEKLKFEMQKYRMVEKYKSTKKKVKY